MTRKFYALRTGSWISVLILVLCILAAARFSLAAQAVAQDLAGSPADPFVIAQGKIVVLIFVRLDCPISDRYAPLLQQLSARHAGNAVFFLVYPGKRESAEAIRKHDLEFKYNFGALRDPEHRLVKHSFAKITPEAAVYDANRHLIYHGRIDNLYEDFGHARKQATTHELEDAIQAATDGKTLSATSVPAVGCYISDLE
jgi:thiol-disulfide isomerase/thioredoxin